MLLLRPSPVHGIGVFTTENIAKGEYLRLWHADDYRFLESVVRRGVPKATMAAPDVMHYFLGPKAFDAYQDREAYFSDLVKIYREEIRDLAAEGCTFLQLDDTALPCNCDAHAREDVAKRGENPDELTERYARLFNDCVRDKPNGMSVAIHLCRGNLKGAWMAEGGYEPIADALFNRLDAAVYCLEYDTERAGDFSPLRFVPEWKARDSRPGQHEDAAARIQRRSQTENRGCLKACGARQAWHRAAMRFLERRRRRPGADRGRYAPQARARDGGGA